MPVLTDELLTTNREGAERVFHTVGTTLHAGKGNIRQVEREGITYLAVPFSTAQDGEVLNGIRYPAEVIADALYSFEGALVPYDHPTDSQGRFVPSRSNLGLSLGHMGGHMENIRRVSIDSDPNIKKVKGDMLFDLEVLMSRPFGKETHARLMKEEPIETSTGFYLDIVPVAPSADNATHEAVWIYCDHNCILPPGVEPASDIAISGAFVNRKSDMSVFVNSKGEDVRLYHITCHRDEANAGEKIMSGNGLDRGSDGGVDTASDSGSVRHALGALTEALGLGNLFHNHTGHNVGDTTMAETETKGGAANADIEQRVEALETNGLTEAKVKEIFNSELEPIKAALEAQNKEIETKAAAHKAALVEKIVASNTLTQEVAENASIEVLEALAAGNDSANDGTQANAAPSRAAGIASPLLANADSAAAVVNGAGAGSPDPDEGFTVEALQNRFST